MMLAQTTQPSVFTPDVLAAVSAAIILIVGTLAATMAKWIGSVGERATKASEAAHEAKTTAAVAQNTVSNVEARVERNAKRTDALMLASPPPTGTDNGA